MHTSRMLFQMQRFIFSFSKKLHKRINPSFAKRTYPYDQRFGKFTCGDIYYAPQKRGRYPIFVNIHGGGFVAGDKNTVGPSPNT